MENSKYLVYGLYDPDTGECRYIGLSTSGLIRPKAHRNKAGGTNEHKKRWLSKLAAEGKDYVIKVLEYVEKETDLAECERKWILFARESDWPITNVTDGGEGVISLEHIQEAASLSDDQIIGVYKCLLDGQSKAEISKSTGISKMVITRIKYYTIRPELLKAKFGEYKPIDLGANGKYRHIAPEVHRQITTKKPLSQIAREFGIDPSIVCLIKQHKIYRAELDALFGPYVPNKEKGWVADYAIAIYHEILKGRKLKDIAQEFEITFEMVCDIKRYHSYGDILEAEFGPCREIPRVPQEKKPLVPKKTNRKPRGWVEPMVPDIYREILKGRHLADIAKDFEVKVSMVEDIKAYRVYPKVLEAHFGPKQIIPKAPQKSQKGIPKPRKIERITDAAEIGIELIDSGDFGSVEYQTGTREGAAVGQE